MLYGDLSIIRELKEYGNVMADPKIYEIPDDMEHGVRRILDAGADIVTVHCSPLWEPPMDLTDRVVGVTVLTSFDNQKCREVYGTTPSLKVSWFMKKLVPFGYQYFVCSAADLRSAAVNGLVKAGKIKPICPSIRLSDQIIEGDDQALSRKVTPAQAIACGAELIVVGRPIQTAEDPLAVVDRINSETGM